MSKRIRVLGITVVIAAAAAAVMLVRQQYVLPIVMYHSVKPAVAPGDLLSVSVDTFERQARFLRDRRYHVISLDEAAAIIAGRNAIPARAVAITFDDGFQDNYTYAFPILKRYNLKATVFVIVSRIGKPGYLTVAQMRQMRDSGLVSFGSHALTHTFLPKVSDRQVLNREIADSRSRLGSILNTRVTAFAYPIGGFNALVRQSVIDAGYTAAVVTNPGRSFANDDVFALKRLRISENARNLFVFWIETSGYYNAIRERRHK